MLANNVFVIQISFIELIFSCYFCDVLFKSVLVVLVLGGDHPLLPPLDPPASLGALGMTSRRAPRCTI